MAGLNVNTIKNSPSPKQHSITYGREDPETRLSIGVILLVLCSLRILYSCCVFFTVNLFNELRENSELDDPDIKVLTVSMFVRYAAAGLLRGCVAADKTDLYVLGVGACLREWSPK